MDKLITLLVHVVYPTLLFLFLYWVWSDNDDKYGSQTE